MALVLTSDLVLTTVNVPGGMETHALLGDTPLLLTRPLLDALTALAAGGSVSEAQALALIRAGVLVDTGKDTQEKQSWDLLAGRMDMHPLADESPDRIVLAPNVVLGCEQLPQPSRSGPVLPVSSLMVSMFVPPDTLHPLQQLADILRVGWQQMVRAAHARDELVDREAARRIMEATVREELSFNPELRRIIRVGEPFSIEPLAPVQTEDIYYPFSALTMSVDRVDGGHVFVTGERVLRIPLLHPDALAQCGRLLGLLQGGMQPPAISAYLAEAPHARTLFGRLVALGLLSGATNEGTFGPQLEPGTVMHLGHASLLANLGGKNVLIDPWLVASSPDDRTPPPGIGDLPPIDAIFITHHHWDHLHTETLLQLDKRIPVYIPRQDEHRLLKPMTKYYLAHLGFADIRELSPGDDVVLGDGGMVTAASFHGEDPTHISYRGCCYVLVHDGRAALACSDSGAAIDGSSLVSTGEAARLHERFGVLSPVFATRRRERVATVDSPWEFLLAPSSTWAHPTENCDTGAAFLSSLCAATGANCLALYSHGGASWLRPNMTPESAQWHNARDDFYEYGWDSLEEIRAAAAPHGADVMSSMPYQRFKLGSGPEGTISHRPNVRDYATEAAT